MISKISLKLILYKKNVEANKKKTFKTDLSSYNTIINFIKPKSKIIIIVIFYCINGKYYVIIKTNMFDYII